jgi:beta-glucosidase
VNRISANILRAALLLAASTLAVSQQLEVWKDPAVPMEKRAGDLLSRMTLEEKVSQMMNDSPAIPRLNIPAYNWWNESLHGVARAGLATVFPQAIGLAAMWDTDQMFRVATVISDEARAKYNEDIRRGKRNIYQGLTFWTPNINLFRDPRWGRGMETYGEDPFLTGRLAVAFIKGMQGDDPKYLKTIATAKHFAVHSGPEPSRHTFDAVIDDRDLRETYLPHFEAAIREGGAYSVMCAYNSVDGQPACANTRLLSDILRKEWGFQGYVVSDCGAIGDIYLNHKFSPNANEGVAKAIKAGTDLNCGVEYGNLLSAVRAGLLKESEIERSLKRLLLARFKLGMFDPPAMVKYAQIPYSENDSPAHRQLAIETARKSIVLLKNENRLLPLAKTIKTIAVIGPNADDAKTQLGNYNGIPAAPVTVLEGIRRKVSAGTRVIYARGSDVAANMPAFGTIPASALRGGLKAEYFNTANFDGKAHRPAELTYPNSGKMVGAIPPNPKPLFTRVDATIDFHWGDAAPRADLNDDDFGIRWTGYLSAPVTGTYQLGAIGMNAYELSLDGKQIVRANSIHGYNYEYAPVELQAGKRYKIALDYHEFVNDAGIQLVWSPPRATKLIDEALAAAKQADTVVMVLGLSPRLEGEEMKVPVAGFSGGDRLTLDLPAAQQELLEKVTAVGKPVVLVLMNGSAVAINWAHDHVPAIVEGWYPGQAGGTAIADVLFGDYNPAGRLPVTFYRSVDQLPAFTDYSMKNRTYRYFTGQPLYPFGYGLSYTSFAYRNPAVTTGKQVKVSVEVENSGGRDGEEVVELYVTAPFKALAGFRRIALKAKEHRTVDFTLLPAQLRSAGSYEISIGGGQPGYLATGVVARSFRVPQP